MLFIHENFDLLFSFSTGICVFNLLMDDDIESNPGSKTKTKKPKKFLCCHCNVNSLYIHDKLSMLEDYDIAQTYDLSLKGYITLLTQTILMMLREGVFVCTTRKTYPLGLSALLTSINVYYVKSLVRIRKVILVLFIAHQVSHVMKLKTFYLILQNL